MEYRSRFTAKTLYKKIQKDGRYKGVCFGQDLCQSTFMKFLGLFRPIEGFGDGKNADSANVSVSITPDFPVLKNGKPSHEVIVKTDASMIQVIDEQTLEPQRLFMYGDLSSKLKGFATSSHEERDPETGEYFNFTLQFFPRPKYHLFRMTRDDPRPQLLTSIRAPAAYIHSFASTKNYIILMVWPYLFKKGGLLIPFHKNYIQSLHFHEDKPVLFYVVDRRTGALVGQFEHEAFFVFHTVNAFEDKESGDILIDACVYKNVNVIHDLYLQNIRDYTKLRVPVNVFRRFRLSGLQSGSLVTGLAKDEFAIPCSVELPRIHERCRQRHYRYAYGISNSSESKVPYDSIVKVDTYSQTVKIFRKDDCMPGEAIFVPDPDGKEEDDGVLVSVILQCKEQYSYLAVIDAKTMQEIATARAPNMIPMGFHGAFVRK